MNSNIAQHTNLNNVLGFSGTQRIGFIGILIGFVTCATGCFPPYWKTGKISINEEEMISVNVLDIRAGVWLFCLKFIGVDELCDTTYDVADTFHRSHWLFIIWAASALCLVLSLVCGLAACCRLCCCSGGKTICHGVAAFLAGVCGVVAVAVFSLKADEVYGFLVLDLDYGWAFFLFIAGSAILIISSFLLCFSSPREKANFYQLMTMPSMPSMVAQASTSTQMNAASFLSDQGPTMYHEMETRPNNIEYGQNSSQFKV